MAFLKINGKALSWEESKKYHKYIKDQAIKQIIKWMNSIEKGCMGPKFGYEFEFHKIHIDDEKKVCQINLSAQEDIFHDISVHHDENPDYIFQPEFGKWMIEVVPNKPFLYSEVVTLELSMENLWKFVKMKLLEGDFLALGSFGMLGTKNFIKDSDHESKIPGFFHSSTLTENPFMNSKWIPDKCFTSHPRFGTLAKNIRDRRGKKVDIQIPIYKDTKTNLTVKTEDEPNPGMITMDCMAFAMGCCCFQITLGFCSLNLSKLAYDLIIPMTPIILALSAGTSILKGQLSGHDTRFDIISQGVDDRTDDEKDPKSKNYIYKSRYSNVYSYISDNVYVQDYHNDYPKFNIDEVYLKQLMDAGIPKRLSEHFCNLMIRDALVIFDEKIDIEEPSDYSHFENFQSTNWNSVRLKPPRLEDNDFCFKIEIRVPEISITPYENAAISTFVILLSQLIYKYDFNTIIPMSKVDENFRRANLNDAVIKEKFWFRTDGLSLNPTNFWENKSLFCGKKEDLPEIIKEHQCPKKDEELIEEMTIEEILCGCDKYKYPGLLWMMNDYVNRFIDKKEDQEYYRRHLEFIKLRSNGSLMTDAKYTREFVLNHKDYKQDSVVTDKIWYDLVKHVQEIQNLRCKPKELYN